MTQIDDVNKVLRMGIKKIDELKQATKELKEALRELHTIVNDVQSERGHGFEVELLTSKALLTKYKDL